MRAAVFRRYGSPAVVQIEEMPKPAPKDDQVLVRVHATTVAAMDWRLRKADPWFVRLAFGLTRPRKPTVLGAELSGVIEALGKDVVGFSVGDAVFGIAMGAGAHAEYVCLNAKTGVALKPANASFEIAASIAFGGLSALSYFKHAPIQPGQKVLIYGASGSVGTHAVQLAKHWGAHVTAVCSTANMALVRSLGADAVVDYTRQDFADAGPVYDVIMDTVGKSRFPDSLRALKRGGAYLLVSGPLLPRPRAIWAGMTGAARVYILPRGHAEPGDLDFLKGLVEAGAITPVIDRRYPLEEIAEAHRLAESGRKKGQVVILMDRLIPT
jgi:NADPH:quinone reductase-like Zn-dependent oxidoreductase